MHNHKNLKGIKIDYLPIPSLEKYLKQNLFDKVNQNFFSLLDTYLFQKRPLAELINQYVKSHKKDDDTDGKEFYGVLLNEIRSMKKDREDLVDIVNRHIQQNDSLRVLKLENYLKEKIQE